MDLIYFRKGNLLEDPADALVNTVNTVGVMGKGIALQFKQAFPEVYREYEKECRKGNVNVGSMHVVPINSLVGPKYVINFPTKKHWRENSKIEYIVDGLDALVDVCTQLELKTVAIPPLGCGNGGLHWSQVRPLIEEKFEKGSIDAYVYVPAGSPQSDKMKIGTTKPKMTKSRALLLSVMGDYMVPGYRLSLLEIQKLAYFLQEVGEPLKLDFAKGKYGPYAENLNFVLQRLEGHYIRGYGDRNSQANISLIKNAKESSLAFLSNDKNSEGILSRIEQVIYGFETPYGMELLATVHWIMKEYNSLTSEDLVDAVHSWNERKKKIFTPNHIEKARQHLMEVF